MDKLINNNEVTIEGVIATKFEFSHRLYGEGFYKASLAVSRLSGNNDIVEVMISERLADMEEDMTGVKVHVFGQFRSYNHHDETRNRLELFVFVREITFPGENEITVFNQNNKIFLSGFVCKDPVYRKTPLGREITDILIAVNRSYEKSDYIPCIAWGRNARFAAGFKIGSHVELYGRIQSREYTKKFSETESEMRIAYEVSASKICEVNNNSLQ